jgi:hypothetical protein
MLCAREVLRNGAMMQARDDFAMHRPVVKDRR